MKLFPLLLLLSRLTLAQKKPFGFQFAAPKATVETYDFWEGTLTLKKPTSYNSFLETTLNGRSSYENNRLN